MPRTDRLSRLINFRRASFRGSPIFASAISSPASTQFKHSRQFAWPNLRFITVSVHLRRVTLVQMVQYIITPWRSQAELLQVRRQLYPGESAPLNLEERKEAVAKVSVWMQRGNCPHLVESTAILMSAILNDGVGNSSYCVRAAYAAAFCRFVTGLLDSHQDRRRKLSMYSIAKTIGLPATYVELRHQATHEELPSLSKLRTATQKALRWIWDYYWSKLSDDPVIISNCREFVSRLLSESDDRRRLEMENDLSKWDQSELVDAVMEIQSSTIDVSVLLRASQLHQRLLVSSESDMDLDVNTELSDLEKLKRELSQMENQLEDSPSIRSKSLVSQNAPPEVVKGWTIWEGPWVAKPIGMV